MTDRPHKIALLGCGRVTQHYVDILTRLDPVEQLKVVACCDLVEQKVGPVAAELGAKAYTDFETLLAESDAATVFVLTESGRHEAHARMALEAGRNVIVEKPVGLRPEIVRELDALADARGLIYGAVFQNRYNPAVAALRTAMDAGRFGKIVTATIRLRWCRYQHYYEDGWHGTWSMDGGVINQQAIHHVDALNWICGPIDSICAASGNRLNQLEAEDTMVATLRFRNGALGTIEATTAVRPEDVEASFSVIGETGIVELGGVALNEIVQWRFIEPEAGDDDVKARCSQSVPNGYGLGHGSYLRDFAHRMLSGEKTPPLTAEGALKAVELVHAMYASIENGGWVRLADKPRSIRLGVGALPTGSGETQ